MRSRAGCGRRLRPRTRCARRARRARRALAEGLREGGPPDRRGGRVHRMDSGDARHSEGSSADDTGRGRAADGVFGEDWRDQRWLAATPPATAFGSLLLLGVLRNIDGLDWYGAAARAGPGPRRGRVADRRPRHAAGPRPGHGQDGRALLAGGHHGRGRHPPVERGPRSGPPLREGRARAGHRSGGPRHVGPAPPRRRHRDGNPSAHGGVPAPSRP